MATGKIPVYHPEGLAKWYLASGLTESDVIAAYQFAYASSQTDALKNINSGTTYTLSKGSYVRWGKTSGMMFAGASSNVYLSNSTLSGMASSIKSCVYGFRQIMFDNGNAVGMYISDSRWLGHSSHLTSGTQSGFIIGGGSGWKSNSFRIQTGILGGNFEDSQIYLNGVKQTMNTINAPYGRNHDVMTYQAGDLGAACGLICPALVLYNKALTDAQHEEIAVNIARLGALF